MYNETISILQTAVHKSQLGNTEKSDAIKKLHTIAANAEQDFIDEQTNFNALIEKERNDSWKYGGKTVMGDAKPPEQLKRVEQLRLF